MQALSPDGHRSRSSWPISCETADPPRPAAARGRGRLPLPPPADPRRRLRGACRRPCAPTSTSASPPGSGSTGRSSSSSTRSSATTSNRRAAIARSSGHRTTGTSPAGADVAWRQPASERHSDQDYGAAASLLSARTRSCRRRVRPRPRNRARRRPLSGRARSRRPSGARTLSSGRVAAGDESGSSAGSSAASAYRIPRAGGRDREAEGARRGGVALFEAARDDLALYIGYVRARQQVAVIRGSVGRGLAAYEQAAAHARRAGCGRSSAGARPLAASGHDTRAEVLSWLDENEPGHGRTLDSVRPCRGAGDARPLRRGARDPHRITCGHAAARRRELLLAGVTAVGPSRSSSGRAIPPPPPSSEQKGAGCSTGAGREEPLFRTAAAESRAGALRGRSAGRSGDLGRPRGGARRSDDVFTGLLWRRVRAKVLARRGGTQRRSTCARGHRNRRGNRLPQGQGRRVRRPSPRCSCSVASASRRPPRSSRHSSATSARRTSRPQSARGATARRARGSRADA